MIVDADLVARLEASAAAAAAATADAFPDGSARAHPCGHGALVAFGPGRYVNRAMGVTLVGLADEELDDIERWFAEAGVPSAFEVCSWCPTSLLDRLSMRGYHPAWFRNVYARRPDSTSPGAPAVGRPGASDVELREVREGDIATWQQVLAVGNEVGSAHDRETSDEYAMALHAMAGSIDLLAARTGEPAGCGSLVASAGVAWLGGAATVPAHRCHGVQSALLRYRLALAATVGCDLVAATALPAGSSARNLTRQGFTLAYAQVVMVRRNPSSQVDGGLGGDADHQCEHAIDGAVTAP